MKLWNRIIRIELLILMFALSAAYAHAQAGQPASQGSQDANATQDQPDTHPLTGAEKYSLGTHGRPRSYFESGLSFRETVDTDPYHGPNQSTVGYAEVFGGQASLQRIWSRYQFSLDYSGGAAFYNNRSGLNSNFHQFGVSQRIAGRRWSLGLSDYFSYLPESGFGAAGGLGLSIATGPGLPPGLGGEPFGTSNNLNPGFIPNQSIFTLSGGRLANSGLVDASYMVSPRGTLTVNGSYSVLHFVSGSFINSSSYGANVGYSYQLTARNSFGVQYGSNYSQFGGGSSYFLGQHASLTFGRRVTGRLALQFAAGPQFTRSKSPGNAASTRISWTVSSSLTYQLPKFNLGASYAHYESEGGGLFFGADSDIVNVFASRQLSRVWGGSVNAAYAQNRALQQVAGLATGFGYRSVSGGVSLSRPLGHYTTLSFNYNLQRQVGGTCSSTICGPLFLRQVFSVGFNWNFRPIGLD